MRERPANKYAREYVKSVNRPLTESDIARAFSYGAKYGQSSSWNRVEDCTPMRQHGEQIVVLSELVRHSYHLTIVPIEEYATYIGNRNNEGIPIFWAYLRTLLANRIKLPKIQMEK